MGPDADSEQRIAALLDGRSLPTSVASSDRETLDDPLRIVDALGRAHRIAIFGADVSPDRPLLGVWGRLEIRGEIGRGAGGTVYRGWDLNLAREVALKLLASDAHAPDALEEGRLLARLNHAHIVRVFGADAHDGVAGIWMELLEGETLDEILERDGVFSPEETLLAGLDLAGALAAVHAAGLLHRDIKARNVLRERGGRLVLMDLGAGRPVDAGRNGGDEPGTPMYMAPEVLAGAAATVQSDIYSLGILLHRLLTRTYPVIAADLRGLRSAHAAGGRAPLDRARPDLPSFVVEIVERACHSDANARYKSAPALEAALTEALRRTVAERTHVPSPMRRRWARWRKTTFIAASASVVALFAGWGAWDTVRGRDLRRALGLTVPPRSTLYLTMSGALGIVRGRVLLVVPYNPGSATPLAVSSDLGIQTMPGTPPWTSGARFRLDGTAIGATATENATMCCFRDGTTDGQFNYAARQDSTLLEPIGSRQLAPAAVYRFNRDWSNPEMLFTLEPDGTYMGVAYAARSESFWLTRFVGDGTVIEQWSRAGRHLSTPVHVASDTLIGLAADPRDGTLWVVRLQIATDQIRLENFDGLGRHLGSLDLPTPAGVPWSPIGAEFAWNERR